MPDDAGVDPDLADRLPEPYARALALVDEGVTGDELAVALDIDPAALPVFLEIAAQKAAHAARALDQTIPSPTEHGEPS